MAYEKMIVVDLNSGSFTNKKAGHEKFNLDRNSLDGMYYGYVPPLDKVDVKNFDKKAKNFVSGVLVIYVQTVSDHSKDREIIAFCENATVFAEPQSGEDKNRLYDSSNGTKKYSTYSIVSDNLTDLRSLTQKFTIHIADFNSYMFRAQKSYLHEYPQLKADIIAYIQKQKIANEYEDVEQINIQSSEPATYQDSFSYGHTPDEIIHLRGQWQIKKNPAVAKKVLRDSQYQCLCDTSHTTFKTPKGIWYMEGHHLIPCTVENSERFKSHSKLDREENIVCICPNCHKAIHYGDDDTKKLLLKRLYNKQQEKLKSVKIDITLEDLFELYRV